jgi:hypothetical protein
MDLTLLEVHFDGARFTANAPGAEPTVTDPAADTPAEDDAAPPLLAFVVGVLALAGLAYLVRRWRSGGAAGTEIEAAVPDVDAPTP